MRCAICFYVIFFVFLVSCKSDKTHNVATVMEKKDVPYFSSGSGMEAYKSGLYAVGDDSPYLVYLDENGNLLDSLKIWSVEFMESGRIRKKEKPDFEAVAIDRDSIYIFGSGSKSPTRDVMIWGDLNVRDSFRIISLVTFYKAIRRKLGLSEKQFNIEGATFFGNKLVLLNRAANQLYLVNKQNFTECLLSAAFERLEIASYDFMLPKINGQEATFSGGAIIPNTTHLLFTASVEANEGWVGDGDILGSFVGIIDLNNLKQGYQICLPVFTKNNERFIGKVEAASVIRETPQSYEIAAITDDDDGTTSFLIIRMPL